MQAWSALRSCRIGDPTRTIAGSIPPRPNRGVASFLDMSHELDMAEYLFGPVIAIQGKLESGERTHSGFG